MTDTERGTFVILRSPGGTRYLEDDPFQPGLCVSLAADEELLFFNYEKHAGLITKCTLVGSTLNWRKRLVLFAQRLVKPLHRIIHANI